MHSEAPTEYTPGAIHLLPVFLLDHLKTEIKTDLFISTFAITETTEILQKTVINKNFFNASMCYIVGQLQGNPIDYVHPSVIHEGVRSRFNVTHCQPSFLLLIDIPAYEIIGVNA